MKRCISDLTSLSLQVNVYENTIRKVLKRYDLFGQISNGKQKHEAWLWFAKLVKTKQGYQDLKRALCE